MTARATDPRRDPARPHATIPVTIEFEDRELSGARGQTVAGILLANDILSWRTTSTSDRPRGAFCGIGICFDCLITIDGRRDVRACLARPQGGEQVERQHDRPPIPGSEH